MSGKAASLSIDGLGLKQPAGWDKPPVHQTASNCWHCGQFSSLDRLTQRDLDEGWHVIYQGPDLLDVTCPDCGHQPGAKNARKAARLLASHVSPVAESKRDPGRQTIEQWAGPIVIR